MRSADRAIDRASGSASAMRWSPRRSPSRFWWSWRPDCSGARFPISSRWNSVSIKRTCSCSTSMPGKPDTKTPRWLNFTPICWTVFAAFPACAAPPFRSSPWPSVPGTVRISPFLARTSAAGQKPETCYRARGRLVPRDHADPDSVGPGPGTARHVIPQGCGGHGEIRPEVSCRRESAWAPYRNRGFQAVRPTSRSSAWPRPRSTTRSRRRTPRPSPTCPTPRIFPAWAACTSNCALPEIRWRWSTTSAAPFTRPAASVPLSEVTTQAARIDQTISQERTFAWLCACFAALALAIACVGLYGTMAYTVARRTNEIGIRMALGAERRRIVWMVLREVFALGAAGLAIGLAVAWTTSRFLDSFLFGIKHNDPWSLARLRRSYCSRVALLAGYAPRGRHRASTRWQPCATNSL